MVFPIINNEDLAFAQEAFDSMLQPFGQGGFAKPCLLVYPPKISPCANCEPSPIANRPSNIYRHGGPVPFPMGAICPACGGQGTFAEEVSETVYLKTSIIKKPFSNIPVQVNLPDGLLSVKGFLIDAPKLQQADFIIHNTALENYQTRKYKLYGEIDSPSNIVQNRYFTAILIRI